MRIFAELESMVSAGKACFEIAQNSIDPSELRQIPGFAPTSDDHRMRTTRIGYPIETREAIRQDLTFRIKSVARPAFYGSTGKSLNRGKLRIVGGSLCIHRDGGDKRDFVLGAPSGLATGILPAAELGVSAVSVSRHWRANGLKPHLVRGFKISRDPKFVEKLKDIVGLYMSPPEHALVLCCDDKSQVQALDRTQPGLPLKKGRAGTMTHDYKRNGTTTLFAALNILNGQVIGQYQQQHTHVEWLKFLRKIDCETPKDILQKVICANSRLSSKQNATLH